MDETARRRALDDLYELLRPLNRAPGQARRLASLTSQDVTATHGVYLFREPGELREDGHHARIVRVGTHALTETSSTTLWSRLRTHRGPVSGRNAGGGSHRSSVFRLHVGTALLARGIHPEVQPSWAAGTSAASGLRDVERGMETVVSERIGAMPLLWLNVPDRRERGLIERGCIALLSNHSRSPVDPPSSAWLGAVADRKAVRESGVWNVNHVEEQPTSQVLDFVAAAIDRTLGISPGKRA